jgi:porphyrinogen peroxidase
VTAQNAALPNGRTPQHVVGPLASCAICLAAAVHPGPDSEVKDFIGVVSGLVRRSAVDG